MNYNTKAKLIIENAKLIAKSGLVRGTWGNISIKENNIVGITPSGVDYFIMQEKDIVFTNLNGEIVFGNLKPSIELNLHLEIYKKRKDVNAIVHTHSEYCTAFAISRKKIPASAEDLVQIVGGEVNVAKYALPGTLQLAKNAVMALNDKNAVLLSNHGLVAVAKTIEEAIKIAFIVEKSAKATIMAKILGSIVELEKEDQKAMRNFYLYKYGQKNEKI